MKNKASYSLFFSAIAILCSSCASLRPVTENIIQQVGEDSSLSDFQYYISRDIILTRVEKERDGNITAGEAKITETTKKDRINIKKSTPGIVIRSIYSRVNGIPSNHNFLDVAFEDDDTKLLRFVPKSAHPDASYELTCEFAKSKRIIYGDALYDYSFPENFSLLKKVGLKKTKNTYGDTPILLIKLKKHQKIITTKRTAKGRRIKK